MAWLGQRWVARVVVSFPLAGGLAACDPKVEGPMDEGADSEDVDVEPDEPEDLEATEMLFTAVTPLWAHLGIVDKTEVLTPLGWWGLPKALERAWSPC